MTDEPRSARPSISCVVPAFNEAENLGVLLAGLVPQLETLTDAWEVIVVDDGSRDATPAAIAPWLARPGVRYVRLSRNFGKEAALTAGIDRAHGEVVLLMDADLQHPSSLVPDMIGAWVRGADMVAAARSSRADEGWLKRLGTWLFYRLVNANSPAPIPVDAGDFRLMDRKVVEALKSLPERNRFMKGLYAWVGFRNELIPYVPNERHAGTSSFSMRRLSRLAFTGVTAFTNAPLRLWKRYASKGYSATSPGNVPSHSCSGAMSGLRQTNTMPRHDSTWIRVRSISSGAGPPKSRALISPPWELNAQPW